MRIGVIGHLGVVGSAVAQGLQIAGHTIVGFDILDSTTSIQSVIDTEVVFICVPTPSLEDGSCDTSRVEATVGELAARSYPGLITIKSTVVPGTTDRLASRHGVRIAFCPEFLRERAALVDFVGYHDVCVIGVRDDAHMDTGGSGDYATLVDAHGRLPKKFVRVTRLEAELAKYFGNVFNALRIVFANEFFEVCKALGADYTAIKGAMVMRDNISDAYLDCNEHYRGFAGFCLPKDTAAFAALAREFCPDMRLFQAIVEENAKFRKTVPEGMRP